MEFTGFPDNLLCGEVQHISVEFRNSGKLPLHQLKVASTNPEFFTFGSLSDCPEANSVYQTVDTFSDTTSQEFVVEEKEVKHVRDIELGGKELTPGNSVTLPMWIRGPNTPGIHHIDFLFYYESTEKNPKVK